MFVTAELLRNRGASTKQVAIFAARWPAGCETTEAMLTESIGLGFEAEWLIALVPTAAWRPYDEATESARDEFKKATESVWDEFKKATESAQDEFKKATKSAQDEFKKATKSALAAALNRG